MKKGANVEFVEIVFGAALVLIVVSFVASVFIALRNRPTLATPTTPGSAVAVVPISVTQLPSGFPPDVPMESIGVVDNYNAVAENGQVQATRSFKSLATVSANFDTYKKFLTDSKNGWNVLASDPGLSASSSQATFLAKNKGGVLTINIRQLPPQPFPATLVEITYTTKPASGEALAATSSTAPNPQ